jgi:hypothetical protein
MRCWISVPRILRIELFRPRHLALGLLGKCAQLGELERGKIDLELGTLRANSSVFDQRLPSTISLARSP